MKNIFDVGPGRSRGSIKEDYIEFLLQEHTCKEIRPKALKTLRNFRGKRQD